MLLVENYDPSIFNVDSLEDAQAIALTTDGVRTSQQRWEDETAYLVNLIDAYAPRSTRVLDFGCGAGRLCRPLTREPFNSWVLGVDVSPSMRREAVRYVDSERFIAADPIVLKQLLGLGARFDLALAVWVLQHVPEPEQTINLLADSLIEGGRLIVLNAANLRFIPTGDRHAGTFRWVNDGIDVSKFLFDRFVPMRIEPPDPNVVANDPSALFCVFEKPVTT